MPLAEHRPCAGRDSHAPHPNVTTITTSSTAYQVAKGSVETDSDGTRQGVLLVPPGTQASVVMPCGTATPLDAMSVRITEYTVGPNGPDQMPASLPSTSAYTYSFETSADEEAAMGGVGIQLSQPVVYYNNNFLNYQVGTGFRSAPIRTTPAPAPAPRVRAADGCRKRTGSSSRLSASPEGRRTWT